MARLRQEHDEEASAPCGASGSGGPVEREGGYEDNVEFFWDR